MQQLPLKLHLLLYGKDSVLRLCMKESLTCRISGPFSIAVGGVGGGRGGEGGFRGEGEADEEENEKKMQGLETENLTLKVTKHFWLG